MPRRCLSAWLMSSLTVAVGLLTGLQFSSVAIGAEVEPNPPKTHAVTPGAFEYVMHVDGTINSQGAEEIMVSPNEWATFTVENTITNGELVKEGDELVRFDRRAFDREVEDLLFQIETGKLAIGLAKIELEVLSKNTPLDLEAAERSAQVAAEEWDYYQKLGEDIERQSTEENLKSVKDLLDGSQEELDQLEKMYKADDLTEETEEIILKRAQREVERAKFMLKTSQIHHDRRLKHELPREKRQKEIDRDREQLNLAKARVSLPLALQQKQIEFKKLEHGQLQLNKRLERLQADGALLILKSPIQGVVVYGQAENGKWTTSDAMRSNLRKGGIAPVNQVLLTIIPNDGAFVTIDIPEKDRALCRAGLTGEFVPTAYPDSALPCQLKAFSRVLTKDGYFTGVVEVTAAKDDPRLHPVVTGMMGKVRLVMVSEKDALTVPVSAVFTDEENMNQHFCYVYQNGAEPRRQPVEVGLSSVTKTHIKSGLMAGDQILLTKPENP